MLTKLALLLENIRFEQSIFTLPFAFLGMVLAARGLPTFHQFFWITAAMVGARSFAMSMNRLQDLDLDARHARASSRPMPSGRLSIREVLVFSAASVALLLYAAMQLNPLCVQLAPIALIVFGGYSYVKRVTWLTHAVLGFALAGSPVGGWVAVTGTLGWEPILLGLVVWTWATGFDILYACGDADEDRRLGVRTIPVRFGIANALRISGVFHIATALLLLAVGETFMLGWPYWIGLSIAITLLIYQHLIVTADDLSRLTGAFFTVNGAVSMLIFVSAFAGMSV
ncbi:MAG: 4-hydroxybenzoate octaprenyltransferase [Nitrospira sp.]|nr:4-hydroxybenzoate octaprenyltransferase [Nitrospira sp.]